ncbi:cobalt-precorrin 5A hydrolase [Clostridium sp. LBM24168]
MKIAVISVTESGNDISERIKDNFDIDFYSKNSTLDFNLVSVSKMAMKNYRAVVFISSTGIAVRAICEHVKSKTIDPAVIVIDSCGKFVISLLSGHLGGANRLAEGIAGILGAIPVITTATDNMGLTAPDIVAMDNDLVIDDLKTAKDISALLVNGKKVAFIDQEDVIRCPRGYVNNIEDSRGAVVVTDNSKLNISVEKNFKILKLIRKDIIVGIGCRRNFSTEIMKNTVLKMLENINIDIRSVAVVTTVDIKSKEKAILNLKDFFGCRFEIFSRKEIKKIQHKFQGSDFVEKAIGIRAVCEPCVYLSGGINFLTEKIKFSGMTLCIGRSI